MERQLAVLTLFVSSIAVGCGTDPGSDSLELRLSVFAADGELLGRDPGLGSVSSPSSSVRLLAIVDSASELTEFTIDGVSVAVESDALEFPIWLGDGGRRVQLSATNVEGDHVEREFALAFAGESPDFGSLDLLLPSEVRVGDPFLPRCVRRINSATYFDVAAAYEVFGPAELGELDVATATGLGEIEFRCFADGIGEAVATTIGVVGDPWGYRASVDGDTEITVVAGEAVHFDCTAIDGSGTEVAPPPDAPPLVFVGPNDRTHEILDDDRSVVFRRSGEYQVFCAGLPEPERLFVTVTHAPPPWTTEIRTGLHGHYWYDRVENVIRAAYVDRFGNVVDSTWPEAVETLDFGRVVPANDVLGESSFVLDDEGRIVLNEGIARGRTHHAGAALLRSRSGDPRIADGQAGFIESSNPPHKDWPVVFVDAGAPEFRVIVSETPGSWRFELDGVPIDPIGWEAAEGELGSEFRDSRYWSFPITRLASGLNRLQAIRLPYASLGEELRAEILVLRLEEAQSDVDTWIGLPDTLSQELGLSPTSVVVPGNGVVCGSSEITTRVLPAIGPSLWEVDAVPTQIGSMCAAAALSERGGGLVVAEARRNALVQFSRSGARYALEFPGSHTPSVDVLPQWFLDVGQWDSDFNSGHHRTFWEHRREGYPTTAWTSLWEESRWFLVATDYSTGSVRLGYRVEPGSVQAPADRRSNSIHSPMSLQSSTPAASLGLVNRLLDQIWDLGLPRGIAHPADCAPFQQVVSEFLVPPSVSSGSVFELSFPFIQACKFHFSLSLGEGIDVHVARVPTLEGLERFGVEFSRSVDQWTTIERNFASLVADEYRALRSAIPELVPRVELRIGDDTWTYAEPPSYRDGAFHFDNELQPLGGQ